MFIKLPPSNLVGIYQGLTEFTRWSKMVVVMPRLVQHNTKGPVEVKSKDGQSFWICQCGLSRNQPYCDGSHNVAVNEEENKLYEYDESQKQTELAGPPKNWSVYKLQT